MKPHIITIAGMLGSGKSSTARCLATQLGYKHFSSGDLFRAMAKERGLTIEEINVRAEVERDIDHAVDARLREMASEQELIIDSRLAFHWIPRSFKVFLSLDPHVAAKRIHDHIGREGRMVQTAKSIEDVYEQTLARRASELKRYKKLYNIDAADLSLFDLIVDTEKNNLDQVVEMVLQKYHAWLSS